MSSQPDSHHDEGGEHHDDAALVDDDQALLLEQQQQQQQSSFSDNDICEMVDEFGYRAFEEYCAGGDEKGGDEEFRWIRTEKEPSADLQNITSAEAVREKIDQVRNEQCKFGSSNKADLYAREWIYKNAEAASRRSSQKEEVVNGDYDSSNDNRVFSVAQFNTLAEGLSSGPDVKTPFRIDPGDGRCQKDEKSIYGGFSQIQNPAVALNFAWRRWRIVEALLLGPPNCDGDEFYDLIAMQEVDRFRGFFAPVLQLFGYDGIFKPKRRSPGVRMGWYSDGCCLFWKQKTFELVSEFRQEYKLGNQVMIVAVLRHLPSKTPIVVGVTHLKAQSNGTNEKIRVRQVEELKEFIREVVERVRRTERVEQVPTIVCGDFNADPPAHVTFKDSSVATLLSAGEEGQQADTSRFWSAYQVEPPADDFYTTWKTRGNSTVKRIIDYIFYRGNVECEGVLSVPTEEELEPSKLPGLRSPSDHLLIAAKFRIPQP